MKKVIIYTIIIAATFCLPACKKFLDVQPLDKLTGNNFFQSKDDVVANIYNLSRIVFNKYNETHFIGATGEYRSGEVLYESQSDHAPARSFVEVLGKNNLLTLLSGGVPWVTDINYNFYRITDWTGYYQAIQGQTSSSLNLMKAFPAYPKPKKIRSRPKQLLYAHYVISLWFASMATLCIIQMLFTRQHYQEKTLYLY
ncbi:hypothetical protein [Pedobacter roseus]|uniref:hypothetical protein n=1 Tax=Pedobacter roseus TaxID=336820 RepID=UPI0037440990